MVDTNTDTIVSDEALAAELAAEQTSFENQGDSTPEDNPLAPEQNAETPEDQEDAEEVEIPVDEQEESANLKLKPKKKSAQERIDELTAARRAAERELDALRAKFEELQKAPVNTTPEPTNAKAETVTEAEGPQPNDLLENGEPKYPLGELDATYIRDLTRFTLQQEREAIRLEEAAKAKEAEEKAAVDELQRGWQERLAVAQEKLPDLQEKGMKLEASFEGLNPEYGQYLAHTIMALDNGPEVLYYLADNVELAEQLVKAGPLKATLGLGELNAMFTKKSEDTPVKVTNAPEPPADRVRGSAGRFEVPDDTDDLSAFEKKFYGK